MTFKFRNWFFVVMCALMVWGIATISSAQEATVPPASVVGPSSQLDTYRISAGQKAGYQAGDRLTVQRAGKTLCQAVVFSVTANDAIISVLGSAHVQKGDQVVFVRRKVAPVGGDYIPSYEELGSDKGAPVDFKAHVVPGKFTFMYFTMPHHQKCEEIAPDFRKWLDKARGEATVAIRVINVGYQASPCVAALPFKSFPCMLVFDRRGVPIALNPGHSTREILNDANYLATMRSREGNGSVDIP